MSMPSFALTNLISPFKFRLVGATLAGNCLLVVNGSTLCMALSDCAANMSPLLSLSAAVGDDATG
eukprot:11187812-Lingulodinium_polyedra.AAC.1